VQEGLEDYIRRARTFQSYLNSVPSQAEPAKICEGLLACARTAETLLRMILLFYNSLRWFSPDHPESLDQVSKEKLYGLKEDLRTAWLGTLIRLVQGLGKNEELRERIHTLLGREGLWPEKGQKKIFDALASLRNWRNIHAHERGAPVDKAHRLVEGFIDFLDWLVDPLRKPGQSSWRIFPAFLTLNVVTRNSCGISSIKYTLTSPTSHPHRQITLYTQQHLSANSGAFFGLPHLSKTLRELWVDPVLIPANLFSYSRAEEVTNV